MRLLILGGTWFLGRTVAEAALSRRWSVTTFSRGQSGTDVPGAEAFRGDRTRTGDLEELAARGPWDVVVDTSGHVPAVVGTSTRALDDHVERYVYVSTVNVYQGWPNEPLDDTSVVRESSPDLEADRPEKTQGLAGADLYGTFKAGCEIAVRAVFDDPLILRPGVLLGPYEYVGRLPWLLRRMERGGPVLAAGPPDQPIQPLDVRDLVAFMLDAIEQDLSGVMNVVAPQERATYGHLLEACRDVTGGAAELEWVDRDWLIGQDIRQWSEIPLWRTSAGAWNVTADRAWSLGLSARPIDQTVADTWEWLQTETLMPHGRQAEIGLEPTKEQNLLAAWGSRRLTL